MNDTVQLEPMTVTGEMPLSPEQEEQALYDSLIDQGYTEEEIENIMALAKLAGEDSILKDQMEYANELRRTPGAEGINSGRVYTAANPLQHIGVGMNRYKGEQQSRDIEGRRMQILDDQTRARLEYLRRGRTGTPPIVDPNADPTVKPGAGVVY